MANIDIHKLENPLLSLEISAEKSTFIHIWIAKSNEPFPPGFISSFIYKNNCIRFNIYQVKGCADSWP